MKESSWGQALVEPNILHGEVKEYEHMVGESRDEVTIEVDESDKGLHFFLG
jgi:hypothetical protein